MLRATPSAMGPSGYRLTSLAPAEYSGKLGPGILGTTTLNKGPIRSRTVVDDTSRAARAATAGAMNWVHSDMVVAPIVSSCSLALRGAAAIECSRKRGSAQT